LDGDVEIHSGLEIGSALDLLTLLDSTMYFPKIVVDPSPLPFYMYIFLTVAVFLIGLVISLKRSSDSDLMSSLYERDLLRNELDLSRIEVAYLQQSVEILSRYNNELLAQLDTVAFLSEATTGGI